MKLGNHRIGVRRRAVQVDGDGEPVIDRYGDPLIDTVDVEIRWCLVTPATRTSENRESEDRTTPTTGGMTVLAPVGADITGDDVVIWPITGRETVDGRLRLDGPAWQVANEPEPWPESLELQIRKTT